MPRISFVHEEMASATLAFLTECLWKDQAFSDINLEYSGHIFRLHRLLLLRSPVLKKLLDKTPGTADTLPLVLNDDACITVAALEVCLSTLYGLEAALDEDNILSVLACAFSLELDSLCDVCITFLPNLVTPSLFLDLHTFNLSWNGKEYSSMLTDVLERYLCRTAFFELRSSLHKLPKANLERLFSSNALWVPTESDRFQLIMEVYRAMKKQQQVDEESGGVDHPTQRSEPKRGSPFKSASAVTHREMLLTLQEFGRSASSGPVGSVNCSNFSNVLRVSSEPTKSENELTLAEAFLSRSDCEFLEKLLDDSKIFYACFSFADLTRARNQAQNMGMRKVVRCVENSLWTKSTVEGLIISEATTRGDLRSCRSFDKSTNLDLAGMISTSTDQFSPSYRYSTEIADIDSFRCNRDFTSDQFYFCGSLFRVVLTIRYDEPSQDHFIGMYLQRTMISNMESWQFCDPRSNVNVHVEFIAGTRVLEMIELDGRLEVPHNNKGYSRFLYVSELPKYLSPSGSLRITVILRLLFDGLGSK